MGFLDLIWQRAKETPDQRRAREWAEARKRVSATTSHPDDHYPFDGMDRWSRERRKKPK